MNETFKAEIQSVLKKSKFAYVSSIDAQGYPNTKAMFSLRHDTIAVHYFSTNYSSKRVQQFLNNPNACVYLCNQVRFMGLMLVGTMEVLTDHDSKAMLWKPRDVMYYPQGVGDPDYCVLKFTAQRGNYYHALHNEDFEIGELL